MDHPCSCREGWICEDHPPQPLGHDDCAGAGMRCLNPDCPWWRGPAPAALDTIDWTDRVSTDDRPPRRQDH
jgi:hypothetical protein